MENDEKNWRRPPAWKAEEELRAKIMNDIHARIDHKLRRHRRCDNYGGFVPGVVILALGLIFLLDSFGYVHSRYFLQFWPVILIVIGMSKIVRHDARIWGAVLLLLGVLLQLDQLGIGHFSWSQLWPLLLIGAGLAALYSAFQARAIFGSVPVDPNFDPRTTLDESTMFGGIQKRMNTREFRGGRLQAIFGGIEIDLRDAELAENEAVLYANAVFGGIELRVPETWFVVARGQGLFGGYSDSTRYAAPVDSDKPKKTLIVVGTALFGGVEIRN